MAITRNDTCLRISSHQFALGISVPSTFHAITQPKNEREQNNVLKKETNHWQQGKSTFHTLDLCDPSRNLDSLVLRLTNHDPGKEGESRLGVELVGDGLAEAKSGLRPNPAKASQAQLWSALVALSWSKFASRCLATLDHKWLAKRSQTDTLQKVHG